MRSDGNCCAYGQGWAAITSGNPSDDNHLGSVLWSLPGHAFTTIAQVEIWVDQDGIAQVVDLPDPSSNGAENSLPPNFAASPAGYTSASAVADQEPGWSSKTSGLRGTPEGSIWDP